MWNDISRGAWGVISSGASFVKKNFIKISVVTAASAIVLFLQRIGVWSSLINWVSGTLSDVGIFLVLPWTAPIWTWFILLFTVLLLIFFTIRNYWYIGKVAGEFYDDFKEGLGKWDYGNDDWKVIDEKGRKILSVGSSDSGGITKKGFNWTDYEFSFETRIVKKASGWIVRAGNRGNFFMIQLYQSNVFKLRPHYRGQRANIFVWMPDDANAVDLTNVNLNEEIKLLKWIKVKILVKGNIVDVYLDNAHALHCPINPANGINIQVPVTFKTGRRTLKGFITDVVMLGNYMAGGVGFRSAPDEAAHFRNVKVKPM